MSQRPNSHATRSACSRREYLRAALLAAISSSIASIGVPADEEVLTTLCDYLEPCDFPPYWVQVTIP